MLVQTCSDGARPARLLFVRHGATAPNLAGLRCGGDLDPPLEDIGRCQAQALAQALAAQAAPIDLLLCSDLRRTVETADILRHALGGPAVRVVPGFRERLLGRWNLQPIATTEAGLAAGETPPGGESNAAFTDRIRRALDGVAPALRHGRVLLVGSKGVGRVLRSLAGLPLRSPLANAELMELQFPGLELSEPAQPSP